MGTTLTPTGQPPNIVARAKAILLTPDSEWQVIDAEPASVNSLYRNYIMILAAIPPIAEFLHGVLFGYGAFGFYYHPTLLHAATGAVVRYAFTLAGAYVLALIVDTLAPTFQGQKNQVQALKLVAYASTRQLARRRLRSDPRPRHSCASWPLQPVPVLSRPAACDEIAAR
ncbi:MAG: Yip1 family protein [Rhodospirillales bacterium]